MRRALTLLIPEEFADCATFPDCDDVLDAIVDADGVDGCPGLCAETRSPANRSCIAGFFIVRCRGDEESPWT